MHVTVIGAGALGRIYGTRLATSGIDVAFLVRPERVAETSPFVIEQINGSREHVALDKPRRVAGIPPETDQILVTVRFDQLLAGDLIDEIRAAVPAPIVVLTPLLPAEQRELEERVGQPIVPAMPGVAGYMKDDGTVRYWVLTPSSTLIEEGDTPEARTQRGELARHLHRAGIPTRVERNVGTTNTATTTSFFPLIAAIDAGSGIDGAIADKHLLETALDAAKECDKLAHKLGRVVAAANILMKFVGPFTLKAGVGLARRISPEAVTFVETHFGAKLHTQHLAMGAAILALGVQHGIDMPALGELMRISRERGGAPAS